MPTHRRLGKVHLMGEVVGVGLTWMREVTSVLLERQRPDCVC